MDADTTENTEAQKETKSIVSAKYQNRNKPKDWLALLIDEECTTPRTKEVAVKDEEGKDTGEVETKTLKGRDLDLEALFDLASANNLDARERYASQVDRPGAPGRLRMTISNMLRAAARKRHGLFDKSGNWIDAPDEFIGDAERTQERDGTKIPKAKPAEAAGDEAAEGDADE